MRRCILALILIFSINFVLASCSEGQININSASLEDLDLIYGVGPSTAQNIIDSRPYGSLDNLINAKGIGEVTLGKIKEEGLACVETSSELKQEEDNESSENKGKDEKDREEKEPKKEILPEPTPLVKKTLNLNPKVIKSETSNSEVEEKSYSAYYLIGFCALLLALYLNKNRKRKNEWN